MKMLKKYVDLRPTSAGLCPRGLSSYGLLCGYLAAHTCVAKALGTTFTDHERMEGRVNPGPGCKEQLAQGCYATTRCQRYSNPDH